MALHVVRVDEGEPEVAFGQQGGGRNAEDIGSVVRKHKRVGRRVEFPSHHSGGGQRPSEALSHLLFGLLDQLACGDVDRHARKANRGTVCVALHAPDLQQPDDTTIAVHHSVFRAKVGGVPLQRTANNFIRGGTVVGVHTRFAAGVARRPQRGVQIVERVVLFGPHDRTGADVPLPPAGIRGLHGRALALLGPAQLSGNVLARHLRADGLSEQTEEFVIAGAEPA